MGSHVGRAGMRGAYVPKSKVKSFHTVFMLLADKYGSQNKACEKIGASRFQLQEMREGKVRFSFGEKIVNHYNKLKAEGKL